MAEDRPAPDPSEADLAAELNAAAARAGRALGASERETVLAMARSLRRAAALVRCYAAKAGQRGS